jgi:hypothetical protein
MPGSPSNDKCRWICAILSPFPGSLRTGREAGVYTNANGTGREIVKVFYAITLAASYLLFGYPEGAFPAHTSPGGWRQ